MPGKDSPLDASTVDKYRDTKVIAAIVRVGRWKVSDAEVPAEVALDVAAVCVGVWLYRIVFLERLPPPVIAQALDDRAHAIVVEHDG